MSALRGLFAGLVLLLLAPLVGAGAEAAGQPSAPVAVEVFEEAVITVNGRPVTRSQLTLAVRRYVSDQILARSAVVKTGRWTPEQDAAFNAQMKLAWKWSLREAVFNEILRNEAERLTKLGFSISGYEVEKLRVEKLKEAGGQAVLDREQGISAAALKDLARDEKLAQAYRQIIRLYDARPTPQEVRDYLRDHSAEFHRPETVRARVIVIRRADGDEADRKAQREDARGRAEKVLALLREKRGDFAVLAEKYSEDPVSAARGGLLGSERHGSRVERGGHEEALERALFGLREGELSGVVEGPVNFYIVEVLKRFATGPLPLEEIEDEVYTRCFLERLGKVEEKYFRGLYERVLVLDARGRRVPMAEFLVGLQ